MENKRYIKNKISLQFYVLLCFTSTACINVCEEPEIYTAAMVNKSGQKVTVKSIPFKSTVPDFFILAPNDSVSWICQEMTVARNIEVYFNDILFESFCGDEYPQRNPRSLYSYTLIDESLYVFTFNKQFLNMDRQN